MWTPKRFLALLGVLAVLVMCFAVYAWFLGGIDGLPVLPSKYLERAKGPVDIKNPPPPRVDEKLRIAFGTKCSEIKRVIKVEVAKKGLLFATDEFKILEDGRVRLEPFSIALFRKKRAADRFPEINTVRSNEAILTFDRPIRTNNDINNRKIIGAELRGAIKIVNNRGSAAADDDVQVDIHKGPLHFSDEKKKIWSKGLVVLVDTKPKPDATMITARGLEIHLDKNANLTGAKSKPRRAKQSKSKISAVQKVVLLHDVNMHLFIESESGFLSGTERKKLKASPNAKVAAKKKQRSQLHIKTQGSFTYDLIADSATFVGPPTPAKKLWHPEEAQVKVTRINKKGDAELNDFLLCDFLKLQFKKKSDAKAGGSRDRTGNKDIVYAVAQARTNQKAEENQVLLVLNSENLAAHGHEMVYRAPTKDKGAETIVKGTAKNPMWALKDAHKIKAVHLRLIAANSKGEGQTAYAQGPGKIDLVDPGSKKKSHRYHVVFAESMRVGKDVEAGKKFDLLTFNGNAAFIDDGGEQSLHADKLQLWIEPPERTKSPEAIKREKKILSANAPRQQPHKLIGFGHVRIDSPKLHVKKCDHLTVRFQDEAAKTLPVLGAPQTAENTAAAVADPTKTQVVMLPPSIPDAGSKGQLPPPPGTKSTSHKFAPSAKGGDGGGDSLLNLGKKGDKNQKPIHLDARQIFVVVVRTGKKNDLRKAMAEGDVLVRQDGKTSKDKGVRIKGRSLDLTHHPRGNVLIVYGVTKKRPAELYLGELTLIGPKVTINQLDNTAEIEGMGTMDVPSNTTFDGGKPSNPKARLTIQWTEEMFFNGKDARFHGRVAAKQDGSTMNCESLRVSLDRTVSLQEGQKKGKSAKVERLICTENIDVVNLKKNKAGRIEQVNRMIATELSADNRDGPINVAGPGRVYLWQQGTMDLKGGNKNTAGKQYYLTRVEFTGRLYSNKYKDGSRIAKFYDNIEVFHLPAKHPNVKVEPTRLPRGTIQMRCQKLRLKSTPVKGQKAKTTQVMVAEVSVRFRTDDYYVEANKATYDQSTETVIFEGAIGSLVRMYQVNRTGDRRQQLTGTKILYNRRTGLFNLVGGQSLTVGQ